MADEIVRVITSDGAVMASAITGREMVEQARQIHSTTPVATAALGRALMGASMMGNQLKGEDNSVTLQFKGGGPLGTITCVAEASGDVRGYVQNSKVMLPLNDLQKLDVGGAVGRDGTLTVIKDLGMREPYVGQVPLVSGEIAEDLTAYFATSEQFPTACALGVLVDTDLTVKAAGGYLIQLLPGADDAVIDKVERGVRKSGYVTEHFAKGVTPLALVQEILSEFEVEVLETVPVAYRCDCSRERVSRALISLGKQELEDIVREQNGCTLSCQFCGKEYAFSGEELRQLASQL
ncbi:MAG: Hsp33 family molecular chaperone HslO [Clostridiales bacterium]|nr:Hsp33 family molecular chaperone HslO [Clostridiales bacterium]MCC8100680.1 Hsp33 family molecular chaperone HslO [Clostridiales bacterium]